MFKNLINGQWVDGARSSRNVNPSRTCDVVGEYAQADEAVRARFIALGAVPTPLTSAQFATLIDTDRKRYAQIIRERGITAD